MPSTDRLRWAGIATVAFLAGAAAPLAATPGTLAAYSDYAVTEHEAGAGVWAPDPPEACGPLSQYARVVYGTVGPDELVGGNQAQVLMGLDGDDVLRAGNAKDCLVGGEGDDVLIGGNAKDVLLGGPGDDYRLLWVYRAKGLPLQVVEETREWRRVCDPNGRLSWVKGTGVDGRRKVLSLLGEPVTLRAKPQTTAKVEAYLAPHALADLDRCKGGWCKLKVRGQGGWAPASAFWGTDERRQCR